MSNKSHPIFEAYPLDGEREISLGRVPTPYHAYNGYGLLIGGTADLAQVRKWLDGENVYPIPTKSGRALVAVWVVDFTEASLGPHQELQFSILVSHRPAAPVDDHDFALLKTLFVDPAARMFCYRLWNDSPTAVAYNRELLALPAALAQGTMEDGAGCLSFRFVNQEGALLCAGEVCKADRTPLAVGWSLLRLLGLRQAVRAFSQPFLEARVVNPITDAVPYNADARSFLGADSPVVAFFDPAAERVTLGSEYAARFDFRPQFVEHFAPFRFVYLLPEAQLERTDV